MEYTIPPCFYRVSVKALIKMEDDKKFLLVLSNNGLWDLPGGGLDWGEKPVKCLKRELKEEMNLETVHVSEKPEYIFTAQHLTNQKWVLYLVHEVKVENMNFTPSTECLEIKFVDKQSISGLKVNNSVVGLLKQM
jgi:ADP-ribose pyrophosphatase YjhB (NUDIX family)